MRRCAVEAGLPSDPAFQAAFGSYLEFESRLVAEASQPGARPPREAPMPRWTWVDDQTPTASSAATAPSSEADGVPALPGPNEPVEFAEHVKPLFREGDRRSTSFAFDLWSVEDVSAHADEILKRLEDGSMPCDAAWPADRVCPRSVARPAGTDRSAGALRLVAFALAVAIMALAELVAGSLAGLSDGAAAATSLRTVVAFDAAAKQTPENLAIADDGTIYVSLAFASQIRRIAPDGTQSTLTMPTGSGITVGVAIDRHHGGDLDVAVRSKDPAAAGIWRVPRANFARPTRIAPLPTTSFPNGIAFDPSGNLYIADSTLGQVWRLARGARQATVWSRSRLLAPTGAAFMTFTLPGANGIKVWHDRVYVSNTSTQNILVIPIERRGRAGKIAVRVPGLPADDFAFAANGDLYVALNPPSDLVMVTPSGVRRTLATHADGLQNTSAVAFDPRPGRRTILYVTNSSYFGNRPSLQDMPTGTLGLRLP